MLSKKRRAPIATSIATGTTNEKSQSDFLFMRRKRSTKNKQRKIKIINIPKKPRDKNKINYAARAAFVRHFDDLKFKGKSKFSGKQKKEINRKYAKYKNYDPRSLVKASKKQIRNFKDAGYGTTPKGIFYAPMRDYQGNYIDGFTVEMRGNQIIERFKERVDIIETIDKTAFLKKPDNYINSKIDAHGLKRGFTIHLLFGPHTSRRVSRSNTISAWEHYITELKRINPKRYKNFKKYLSGIKIVTSRKAYEKAIKQKNK